MTVAAPGAGSPARTAETERPHVFAPLQGPAVEREPSPLLLLDLLNDFDRLAGLLPEQVRTSGWLNAFLLAAGLNQIVEDYLHPDPLSLGRAVKHLPRLPQPAGKLSAGLAQVMVAGLSKMWARTPGASIPARWQRDFVSLVRSLASIAAGVEHPDEERRDELLPRTHVLLGAARSFPRSLRRSIARLPSCFRSFDQHPDDLKRLVNEFALQVPDRTTPILSIGLRTSGSYLAPLVAAYLQGQGYEQVQVLTVRPARHLLATERSILTAVARSRGIAILTDDPPATGASLAHAATEVERTGFSLESIVLMLPLFGQKSSLPESLSRYRSLILPWEEWSVNRRLAPEEVHRTLSELLGPDTRVSDVQQVDRPQRRWERSHAHGLYRVEVTTKDRETQRIMVGVKGAGLGYFGEHALAVADRLGEYLPKIYGLRDGLLYRAWLDEGLRAATGGAGETLATGIAAYVAARARQLSADRDRSRDMAGRSPAWEAAANLLSQANGRLGVAMRPIALDAAAKRLLAVDRPAITDGDMDLARWFAAPDGSGSLLKVDPAERAFSNLDLACYDPVFDLAGAAVSEFSGAWPDELRRAYETATGEGIDEERWLLYQLLQLWERGRTGYMADRAVDRAGARALQRYYGARYLGPMRSRLSGSPSGPLAALDLDGVLESQALGFLGLTPASAEALGALLAHGYQPVLVTGRSLDEVRERCDAYGLAGGAAEYGSVLYLKESDDGLASRTIDLLWPEERDVLERLRTILQRMPGVGLDPAYRRAVRAFRTDLHGGGWRQRRALTPDQVQAALVGAEVDGLVRTVRGHFQTDFVAARIDKGIGLQALVARLNGTTGRYATAGELWAGEAGANGQGQEQNALVALAVGDTEADIPMLELAEHAWAPANADAAVRRAGVRVARQPYQAGLAEAVRALLGHQPGCCAQCRLPELPDSARLLADILAARENGRRLALAWRALRLAVAARRMQWPRRSVGTRP